MLNEPCNSTLWNSGYFSFSWYWGFKRIIAKMERNTNYVIPLLSEVFFCTPSMYLVSYNLLFLGLGYCSLSLLLVLPSCHFWGSLGFHLILLKLLIYSFNKNLVRLHSGVSIITYVFSVGKSITIQSRILTLRYTGLLGSYFTPKVLFSFKTKLQAIVRDASRVPLWLQTVRLVGCVAVY